jgi:hypothetical protein
MCAWELLRNPLPQLNSLNLTSSPPMDLPIQQPGARTTLINCEVPPTHSNTNLLPSQAAPLYTQVTTVPSLLPLPCQNQYAFIHTWQQSREEFFSQIRWCHMQTISTRQLYKMINIWRQPLWLAILGMCTRSAHSKLSLFAVTSFEGQCSAIMISYFHKKLESLQT